MKIENIRSSDYDMIIGLLSEWWNGREVAAMLPRLFFTHFNNTSFIIKEKETIVGFIVGFISQTEKTKAYVHFIGVNPVMRNRKIGKLLYTSFFQAVRTLGVKEVLSVTSIDNKSSISFHQRVGFDIMANESLNDSGNPYYKDYDGPGQHRVLFKYNLENDVGVL